MLIMLERQITKAVQKASREYPVVVVHGPRQSGKTTLCKMAFPKKNYYSLENPDVRERVLADPRSFFEENPRGAIIDEIQNAPELLSYMQQIVDDKKKNGLFILTGSNNLLLMDKVTQTLAGRIAIFTLLPFSLGELQSNASLLKKNLDTQILYGGYPRLLSQKINRTSFYQNYIASYVERDVRQLLNIKDASLFRRFLQLCATRIGNMFDAVSLSNDCGISVKTVNEWLSVLEMSFICFRLQPWYQNRNKRLVRTPKIYFYDTGVACSLLGLHTPEQLNHDPLRGGLFENLVISEALKSNYNSAASADFWYYRTSNGVEVDLVRQDGRFLYPVEIKSSQTFHPDFVKNIEKFSADYSDVCKQPKVVYAGKEEFIFKDMYVCNYLNAKI